jgi:hypothetical protein
LCLPASWAKDKDAGNYPLNGKVLASSAKGMHSYQVATNTRVYLLLCEKVPGFHMGLPDCKVGDRPIASGDAVEFRVEGDWAYMPAAKGGEEELRILTTEMKEMPPLPKPAVSESGKGVISANEQGMVIGTGMHILGQKKVGWSTNPALAGQPNVGMVAPAGGIAMATPSAPVIATGPVMAIPATGGAPVMVMPTGPTGGGVVTGIPVTGGAPVIGMATGPVMGIPIGGAPMGAAHAGGAVMGGGAPPWVHILRVRVGETIYQLEGSAKPCELDKKPVELGDTLAIRVEKKWAYLSSGSGSGAKEQKFRILGETEDEATPGAKEAKPDTK